jgi:hypothetical protein
MPAHGFSSPGSDEPASCGRSGDRCHTEILGLNWRPFKKIAALNIPVVSLPLRELQAAEKRCGPWFDKLTMRSKPLKSLTLILSLSKDGALDSAFFGSLLMSRYLPKE